jgi:hypothetical protein
MSNLTEEEIIKLFDEAPEGATHISDDGCFYKIDTKGNNDFHYDSDERWYPCALSDNFVKLLTPRPVTKPISMQSNFTDANGNEWECIKVNSDGTTVYKIVDTRTDTQKAYEEVFNLTLDVPTWRNKSEVIIDAIKAGKIHNVTFTGES